MIRPAVSLTVFAGLWLAAPSVRADTATEAAGHFQAGLRHGKSGELEQAAREFQRAYEISPHYSVLYNLGQTFVLMGRPAEAVTAFERYLDEGGAQIPKARRRAVETSIEFQSKRLGELSVTVEPAIARVELDGQPFAPGAAVRVAAGHHGLWFTAPGYTPRGESVLVEAGSASTLVVRLEPAVKASNAALVECAVSEPKACDDGSAAVAKIEHDHRERDLADARRARTWSYVLTGSGVALGGVGLTLWLIGREEHDEWLEQKRALESEPPSSALNEQLQEFQEQTVKVQKLNDWSLASSIAGGALVAAGAVLFFTAGDPERYGTVRASVTPRSSELSWSTVW